MEEEIKELEIHTKIIIEEGLDSDDNIQSMLQKWLDLYQKEKEKNKELEKDTKKTIDTILHKYVSKDKIKNKIEEYIETLKTAINIQTIQECKYGIKVLQELLKE